VSRATSFAFAQRIFPEPIGKGGALIEGLKLAPAADVIGYVDADGASPPRALHELIKRIDQADCVIGSRWLQARSCTRRKPGCAV
jgi:glycosyltransferase involved in cell wall biosynthesis